MAQNRDAERSPVGAMLTELIFVTFRANGRLLRAGDSLSRDLELTSARWQVLGAVEFIPKTVAQIARDYELTRQGVLWVVQSMVKNGLVELIQNPDHRRAKLVRATDRGRGIYEEVARRQVEWSNIMAESFSEEELPHAIAVMTRLSEAAFASLPRLNEEEDA